jgi:hypothetical protein
MPSLSNLLRHVPVVAPNTRGAVRYRPLYKILILNFSDTIPFGHNSKRTYLGNH